MFNRYGVVTAMLIHGMLGPESDYTPMTSPPLLSADHALFLDFDGTLVDFAPSPDGVKVDEDLPRTLKALRDGLGGAFALVTGRSLASLGRHVEASAFSLAGEHGAQWRVRGEKASSLKPVGFRTELLRAHDQFDDNDGIEIEDKAGGFAVHYRRAPQWERLVKSLMHEMVAEKPQLQVLEGNMLVELRASGVHKGLAVDRFMEQPPFQGRIPVFVGDDTTDEDGFLAVNDLNGLSVKVGAGDTFATAHLRDIAAVHDWLVKSAAALQVPA